MPKPKPRRAALSRHRRQKKVPLDSVSVEALKEQEIAFREKFGRDPGPNDPIFFDPDSDEPRPIAEADYTKATIEAMRLARLDPALIYAFETTGMLVTESNIDRWSSEDLDEWNAALQEYKEVHRKD